LIVEKGGPQFIFKLICFINGVGKLNAATQALSAIGTFLKGRLPK
jgi:hypothetical protein